jgi:two-component system cell cycle response regulator
VLVVADCSDVLELLHLGLALLRWNVVFARSGQEALNKLAFDSPNVILLDMRMAQMNGLELARVLKAHPVYGKIPILAASGYSDGPTREQCLAVGCANLIAKPFAFSELEAQLAGVCQREN